MKIFEKTCRCVFITLFLFGCGYKVVNYSEINNFDIASIETSGNKRINYKIKNKLLQTTNAEKQQKINLKIETKKEKKVKEKNLKNEVTKYEIKLTIFTNYRVIGKDIEKNFKIEKEGEYAVNSQHSQTLLNEKKLIDTLSDGITDEIIKGLIQGLNAI